MDADTIVAEIHRTREQLAAKFNYDIDAIFADIQQREQQSGARVIHRDSRSPAVAVAPDIHNLPY